MELDHKFIAKIYIIFGCANSNLYGEHLHFQVIEFHLQLQIKWIY